MRTKSIEFLFALYAREMETSAACAPGGVSTTTRRESIVERQWLKSSGVQGDAKAQETLGPLPSGSFRHEGWHSQ
jgi:hypothetical protein